MSDDNNVNDEKKTKQPVLSLIEGLGESKPSDASGLSADRLREKAKPKGPPKKVEDILGKSIANVPKPPGMRGKGGGGGGGHMDLVVLEQARQLIESRREEATSDLAMLRLQTDSLSECVQMAAEIYKHMPMPDHAYQLSALTTAYNSSLAQAEKMKDPELILDSIESVIEEMFTSLLKAMALEINKTKSEMQRLYPDSRVAIDDLMNRMLSAIAPESQRLYEELNNKLCKALGVKPKNNGTSKKS